MNEVSINKQAKLSEHITLGELTKTKHVTADGNIPSREVIENLKRLCWWLEELRYSYNTLYCLQPGEDYETSENVEGIVVNSGYRSPAVNKLAGGVATSNHVTATNQLHKGLERLCQNAETQRRRDHDMSVCAKGLTSKSVLDTA